MENSNNKEAAVEALLKIMEEQFEKRNNEPFPYIVAYYKQENDELIGYHLDTFNSISKDPMQAKVYHGDNPYKQLEIISDNLKGLFRNYEDKSDNIFSSIIIENREAFGTLKLSDIYIDAVYITEKNAKRSFKYSIINKDV